MSLNHQQQQQQQMSDRKCRLKVLMSRNQQFVVENARQTTPRIDSWRQLRQNVDASRHLANTIKSAAPTRRAI